MKVIYNFFKISVVSIMMLFSSCDDILDLGPIDYYGNSNFWQNKEQVQSYIYGIHTKMRSYDFTRRFYFGEGRGGLQVTGTSSQGVSTYDDVIKGNRLTGDNAGLSSWGGLYGMVFDCNLVIQNIEGGSIHLSNKADVDYLLAQVYGIRSMLYFTMYRAYGGVPIVKKVKVLDGQVSAEELYTARSKPEEVMAFIKEDIDKSISLFEESGKSWVNNVTWSKAATQMLGAQVYLWSAKVTLGGQKPEAGDLTKAESFLNDLKGNSQFGLLNDFANIFLSTNESNKEIIFATNYADGEATSSVGNFMYAEANIVSFFDKDGAKQSSDPLNIKSTGLQRYEYTLNFWKSFDANDTRRDATFWEYYKADGTVAGTVVRKFMGSINSTGARVYDTNMPVFRFADVILMLAEVENMKGGDVASYVNIIRKRAYGANWDESVYGYTNSSFKDNEYAILHERDREFVMEGTRWYDVVRMKDAADGESLAFDASVTYGSSSLLSSSDKYMLLWPVDKSTLNADPLLKQTPGFKVADQEEEVW